MDNPFLGTISLFGGDFAPRGWAFCNGQLLSIAQYQALFSILGTTYGGNGVTTFALPDLRGRAPIHWGQGPGLTNRVIGEMGGEESVTLINTQIPAHTHPVMASSNNGNQPSPASNVLATGTDDAVGGTPLNFTAASGVNTTMAPNMIGPTGGSQPHDNMQPFLAVTFIIALEGIYPSRG